MEAYQGPSVVRSREGGDDVEFRAIRVLSSLPEERLLDAKLRLAVNPSLCRKDCQIFPQKQGDRPDTEVIGSCCPKNQAPDPKIEGLANSRERRSERPGSWENVTHPQALLRA